MLVGLKTTSEVVYANAQGFGNSNQRIQRNVYAAAFNFTKVFGGKIGLFRKRFLAHTRLLATGSDCLTQNSAMLRPSHGWLRKQEAAFLETRYMCYFLP